MLLKQSNVPNNFNFITEHKCQCKIRYGSKALTWIDIIHVTRFMFIGANLAYVHE